MGNIGFIFILVSALALSLGFPSTAQDWERANAETVRLKPAAFSALPVAIRQELERRGCEVPQTFSNKAAHNVIRGRFTSATQKDVAVLCSKQRVSTVLVAGCNCKGLTNLRVTANIVTSGIAPMRSS